MTLPILFPLIARFFGPRDAATILVHSKDQPVGDGFIQARFFHALRCRFPSARITLAVSLGGSAYAGPLKAVMAPFIDEVLCDQALCLDRKQMRWSAPRPLNGRRFDLVIDLEKVWWQSLAVRRVRHRQFISASKHFLFSHRWPRSWKKPARLADQYFMLLDAVGMPVRAEVPMPAFLDPAAMDFAAGLLPAGPIYVGLVPGAGDRAKCWPLDRYVALARSLAASGRVPVFLLGPQEADWVAPLGEAVPEALFPGWCDGAMRPEFRSPLQTVAIGRRLAAAVTNDCGIAHMLAAADTPLVVLFGFTNPVKYAPMTRRLTALSAGDYGSDRTAAIPLDAVASALEGMLSPA